MAVRQGMLDLRPGAAAESGPGRDLHGEVVRRIPMEYLLPEA